MFHPLPMRTRLGLWNGVREFHEALLCFGVIHHNTKGVTFKGLSFICVMRMYPICRRTTRSTRKLSSPSINRKRRGFSSVICVMVVMSLLKVKDFLKKEKTGSVATDDELPMSVLFPGCPRRPGHVFKTLYSIADVKMKAIWGAEGLHGPPSWRSRAVSSHRTPRQASVKSSRRQRTCRECFLQSS